ncbi:acetolactate decarboxylase [Psychroflexus salis]|uniref:Alpha-acetolactate decarboxylase n=1 Tax=Psychroflexus salis TaxID=1526574 RepID=A0A917E710_9FLAO|nr:acetolactate decarboxylase [Psychroflexus salis]GGE06966.1 hypothetical protein GCM10010831_05570 [Psychroflexus salis]
MKKILVLLLLILFSTVNAQKVYTIGKAMDVMKGIDLSAKVKLDTLVQKSLFALGPVAELQGEITILNGEIYVSAIQNKKVVNTKPKSLSASFLVYSYPSKWDSFFIEKPIKSLKELEKTIEEIASEKGINTNEAFPFIIEANFDEIQTHIINKNPSEKLHNHEMHKKAKVKFTKNNKNGSLLGFYSKHHEGIFTHKGSYLHLHYVNTNTAETGHLDQIVLSSKFIIKLPSYLVK